jgi:hypothetical protein
MYKRRCIDKNSGSIGNKSYINSRNQRTTCLLPSTQTSTLTSRNLRHLFSKPPVAQRVPNRVIKEAERI